MSRIKRDKRTEKRHGRAADAPRRYSRRKHRLFSKKLACKLRRVPFLCTICIRNTLSGKKCVLECNHSFHRKCIKQWLETDPRRTCPNCRRYVSPITGLYQLPSLAVQRYFSNPFRLLLVAADFLSRNDDRRPIRGVSNLTRNLATSSRNNLVNINIDLDDQSSQLDNSIIQLRGSIFSTGLVDPSSNSSDSRTDLSHPSRNLDNRNTDIEDQSSHLDISSNSIDSPSNVSDSRTNLPHQSPNLDNRNTHIEDQSSNLDNSSNSIDPSSNVSDSRTDSSNSYSNSDIPARELPGPSCYKEDPKV